MEIFFVIGLVAVIAAGAAGFALGKRSVQVPDVDGRLEDQKQMFEQQARMFEQQIRMLEQQKKELQETAAAQLASAEESCRKQISAMQEAHREQTTTLNELHNKQLAETKESLFQQLEEAKGAHAKQLAEVKESLSQQLEEARQVHAKQLSATRESYTQQLATIKESNEKQIEALKAMNKEQVESQINLIKEQMQSTSEKVLKMREEQLGAANREQVSKIMDPLQASFKLMKEQMAKMEESVQKVNTDSAERKATITQTIEALAKETMKVGQQAGDLAKALKNKSKVQGDWGEQVLENILEGSGLRKDEDYFTQHNVKGEGNENLRPDVIVKCPGEKFIVIDSKVSLTAYLDYVAAEDPAEQKKGAQENLASIRKHIDELSAKNYEKLVGNTISHVLMFIPNEGSYILALQTDPKVAQYAFSKNVLLINPTNLMMSLKLIYNIWQSERQTRNVEVIVAESTGLYEKFAGFLDTFTDVGTKIQSLQKAFDTAENQLCSGRGNLIRRVEGLRDKGILPKKSLPDKYLDKARE